ncbi:hypothetical protein KEG38_17450 [Polyangium jinanense]|uniref:hypothetical protein n=1 Tax=Polyangium jinanense TaxID=2829994 RepID=UPI002341F47E|nr:hypothetical protein [Polyangium jinanense]MDC3955656.1 hypothetical protein [Polyangium jinanense]
MKPIVALSSSVIFLAACLTPDAVPSPERDGGAGGMGGPGGSSAGGGGAGGSGGAATGDVLWGKAFGGQFNHQRASGVAVDPMDDSIYLVGNYDGGFSFDGANNSTNGQGWDIYLAKFNPLGAFQWVVWSGDWQAQYVNAVTVGPDQNIFIAGSYQGELQLPNGIKLTDLGGQSDVFVARLDPEGATVWAKGFGDGSSQPKIATTIAVDSKGETIIAGYFEGSLQFASGQLINAIGGRDVFLAKLDKDGNPVWSKRLGNGAPGDPPNHILCRVALDHQDNIVLETAFAGTMSLGDPLPDQASPGSRTMLLAKFDTNGVPLWQKVFGAANTEQRSRALAIDSKNNILLTGELAGTINFGGDPLSSPSNSDPDLFVAKFDPDGAHLWSFRAGSVGPQEGKAIGVDADDNVIVTGSYKGVLQFTGDDALINSGLDVGRYDLFALKLDPNGKYLWAKPFGDKDDDQVTEGMAIDRAGNTIFAGSFDGNINLGVTELSSTGYDDIFVMKLSP